MKEEWRDIDGYEGLYQISNLGQVKSLKFGKERIMKQKTTCHGYKAISLSINGENKEFPIHRLVAQAFIDNPYNKPVINHKDCNKTNNNVDNLEWCTQQENIKYSYDLGRITIPTTKKPVLQYDLEGNFVKEWYCLLDAIKKYKNRHICECCRGKRNKASNYIWRYK